MTKTCKKCGESKPIEDFYKDAKNADGHYGKCKTCVSGRVIDRKNSVDVYGIFNVDREMRWYKTA